MKVEELRIGNYVLINNKKSHAGLKNIPFKVVGINRLKNYSISLSNDEEYEYNQYLEYIEPIYLTEDLLLKCGFKRKVSGIGWDKFVNGYVEISLAPLKDGFKLPVYYCNGEYIKLLYLHQLQNLYYALTQTEL